MGNEFGDGARGITGPPPLVVFEVGFAHASLVGEDDVAGLIWIGGELIGWGPVIGKVAEVEGLAEGVDFRDSQWRCPIFEVCHVGDSIGSFIADGVLE